MPRRHRRQLRPIYLRVVPVVPVVPVGKLRDLDVEFAAPFCFPPPPSGKGKDSMGRREAVATAVVATFVIRVVRYHLMVEDKYGGSSRQRLALDVLLTFAQFMLALSTKAVVAWRARSRRYVDLTFAILAFHCACLASNVVVQRSMARSVFALDCSLQIAMIVWIAASASLSMRWRLRDRRRSSEKTGVSDAHDRAYRETPPGQVRQDSASRSSKDLEHTSTRTCSGPEMLAT